VRKRHIEGLDVREFRRDTEVEAAGECEQEVGRAGTSQPEEGMESTECQ
jgi:hypothetical protein